MAANFAYLNTRDLEFILQEWLPTEEIFSYPKFADYYSKEDVKSFMAPILKMCKEVVEPSNTDGEENPVKFENGKEPGHQALGLYSINCSKKAGEPVT